MAERVLVPSFHPSRSLIIWDLSFHRTLSFSRGWGRNNSTATLLFSISRTSPKKASLGFRQKWSHRFYSYQMDVCVCLLCAWFFQEFSICLCYECMRAESWGGQKESSQSSVWNRVCCWPWTESDRNWLEDCIFYVRKQRKEKSSQA